MAEGDDINDGQAAAEPTGLSPEVEAVAHLFPGYEILGLLGVGGVGSVYKARHTALDRLVAIKVLPIEISVKGDFAERFRSEAVVMAKLSHPNIVSVHDFGQTEQGQLFFVMEYVDGANLFEVIHQVGLGPDQALSVTEQICAALGYAHGKGVVHRDLKPGNVMIDRESNVKVADFGLARVIEADAQQGVKTSAEPVYGTPDYMAPEQRFDMGVDHRADIFSLGIMLYEMLCREVPRGAFQLPSVRTGCDRRIDSIVMKAMQQVADLRYSSAQEMEVEVTAARKPLGVRPAAPKAVATPMAGPRAVRPPALTRPAAGTPARVVVTPSADGGGSVILWVLGGLLGCAIGVWILHYMQDKPEPGKPSEVASANTSKVHAPEAVPPADAHKPTPAASSPTPEPMTGSTAVASPTPPVTPPSENPPGQPQETPSQNEAAATPAPAQTAMQKWIAATDAPWQAAFKKSVTDVHDAESAKLKLDYVNALETAATKVARTGDLDGALALRAEEKRFTATESLPDEDEAGVAASVKPIRAAVRLQLAKLDQLSAVRARALLAKYDQVLAQTQTQLTQHERLDDALLVKTKRDEVAAAWLAGVPSPAAPVAPVAVIPTRAATPVPKKPAISRFTDTKWLSKSKRSRINFKPGGSYTEKWDKQNYGGRWKIVSDDEVEVERSDLRTYHYVMSPDGKSLKRQDEVAWDPVE